MIDYNISMILNPRHRKKIQLFWAIISILVAISMVLLYAPGFFQ